MSNLPLKPLKWRTQEEKAYAKTIFRSYHVTRDKESKDKFCVYYGSRTGKPASGFATIEDAKHWAEYEHYAGEMQPYVVPSPTYTMLSKSRPSADGHYLTLKKGFTYEMGNLNDLVPHVGFWNGGRGCFDEDHNNMLFVAWMPIPEFKKGE